jgi:hypothetical protein
MSDMDVIRLADKFVNEFIYLLISRLFLQKIIGTQIAYSFRKV